MQPQLTLKDGNIILLSNEIYEAILKLLEQHENKTKPAASIDELENEFAELFDKDGASIADLLQEHRFELEREARELEMFDRKF